MSDNPLDLMRKQIGTGMHSVNSFYKIICEVLEAEATRVNEETWSVSLAGALVEKLWPLIELERAATRQPGTLPAPVSPETRVSTNAETPPSSESTIPQLSKGSTRATSAEPLRVKMEEFLRSYDAQFGHPSYCGVLGKPLCLSCQLHAIVNTTPAK